MARRGGTLQTARMDAKVRRRCGVSGGRSGAGRRPRAARWPARGSAPGSASARCLDLVVPRARGERGVGRRAGEVEPVAEQPAGRQASADATRQSLQATPGALRAADRALANLRSRGRASCSAPSRRGRRGHLECVGRARGDRCEVAERVTAAAVAERLVGEQVDHAGALERDRGRRTGSCGDDAADEVAPCAPVNLPASARSAFVCIGPPPGLVRSLVTVRTVT
jgi:hypothetical protein